MHAPVVRYHPKSLSLQSRFPDLNPHDLCGSQKDLDSVRRPLTPPSYSSYQSDRFQAKEQIRYQGQLFKNRRPFWGPFDPTFVLVLSGSVTRALARIMSGFARD